MKKNMLPGLLAAVMLLFVSCAGTSTSGGGGAVGYFPVRSIAVDNIADLQSGSFEIIGTVTGKGRVSASDASVGDSHSYGSLEVLDVDRMYYDIDRMPDPDDPSAVSLANAVADLIDQAREQGAAFVTFPSYSIRLEGGAVETTASAIAVRLVDPSPVVVVNRSKQASDVSYIIDATVN